VDATEPFGDLPSVDNMFVALWARSMSSGSLTRCVGSTSPGGMLLVLGSVGDASFRPMNLSTEASSSRLLLVKSCSRPIAAVEITPSGSLAPRFRSMNCRSYLAPRCRACRVDMKVVEDQDVDAAVERMLVRLHVGLDRLRRKKRPLVALDRMSTTRKVRCSGAWSSNTWKSSLRVSDEVALLVGDDRARLPFRPAP
jgi:hypothetical protein